MLSGISEKSGNFISEALNQHGVFGQPRYLIENNNNCYRVSINREEACSLQQQGINLGKLAEQLSSEMGITVTYSTKSVKNKGTIHNLDFDASSLHHIIDPPPQPTPRMPKANKAASKSEIDKLSTMLEEKASLAPNPADPQKDKIRTNITRLVHEGAKKWQGHLDLTGKFRVHTVKFFVFVNFNKGALNLKQLELVYKHCREAINVKFNDKDFGIKAKQGKNPYFVLNKRRCVLAFDDKPKPITHTYSNHRSNVTKRAQGLTQSSQRPKPRKGASYQKY